MAAAPTNATESLLRSDRRKTNPDYRKLAGMSDQDTDMDNLDTRSETSRSSKVVKKVPRNTGGSKTPKTKKMDVPEKEPEVIMSGQEGSDENQEGMEEGPVDPSGKNWDALSMGSDASQIRKLDEGIEATEVTMAERYGEYKVQQGIHIRIEDMEVPENLDDEGTYNEEKQLHMQQLKASEERAARAKRRVEMLTLKDNIMSKREQSRKDEWLANRLEKERELKMNQIVLERAQQKLDMQELEDMERKQRLEFEKLKQRGLSGATLQHASANMSKGINPLNTGLKKPAHSMTSKQTAVRVLDYDGEEAAQLKRTEQWVASTHSHSDGIPFVPGQGKDNGAEAMDIQGRAEKIIARKKRERAQGTNKATDIVGATPFLGTCPSTGIDHLKKLDIIPDNFGRRTSLLEEAARQEQPLNMNRINTHGNSKCTHELHYNNQSRQIDQGDEGDETLQVVRPKVKSGKYAKTNINIMRQETWPHTTVSRKYAKRTTFDNLDYETFIAGETTTIAKMLSRRDDEASGRLNVLNAISLWQCKTRNWPMVKNLFEAIIDEIELGDRTWNDDISSFETLLTLNPAPMPNTNTSAAVTSHNTSNNITLRKTAEVYWCKAFQTNSCELPSPHMAQIKVDEPQVPVLHICATCWGNTKKRREHPEIECNAKK